MRNEMFDEINSYFLGDNGVDNYIPLAIRPTEDENIYVVLGKYVGSDVYKQSLYAVWTCWNKASKSLNFGHYDLYYDTAMEVFYDGVQPQKDSKLEQLKSIAIKLVDNIVESELEKILDKADYNTLGIEPPKKYKKVNVELSYEFEVLMPEDEDEYDWADYVDLHYIIDNECSNESCNTLENNISSDRARQMEYDIYSCDID